MMNTLALSNYRNVGRIDALVRAVIALTLLGIVISIDLDSVTSFVLAMLSIPTMLFALLRWDPIYSMFGLGTNKEDVLKA